MNDLRRFVVLSMETAIAISLPTGGDRAPYGAIVRTATDFYEDLLAFLEWLIVAKQTEDVTHDCLPNIFPGCGDG